MRNIKYQALATHTRPAGTSGSLKSAPIEILRGVKTHALLFGLDLDVTITGASGGSVSAEGTQRLIDLITIRENGTPRVEITGRALAYFTSRAQKQAANIGALAAATAQANTLVHADFVIDFASIYGADPAECAFVERSASLPTTVEVSWRGDAQGALISGTGLTLNSATLTMVQMFDPNSRLMPFFLPRIKRRTSKNISGSQSNFSVEILPEGGNRIESILLHALTDDVTSATVLDGQVTLRGDKERYIDTVDRRTILNELRRFFDTPAPLASYLELPSRFYGKLSEMYIAAQDDNLRVEVKVTGAGTTCVLDVFTVEKESIPGYTRDLPAGW